MTTTILTGDCRKLLYTLEPESFDCCITSPPYWGLRSYLPDDDPDKVYEIGSEPTLEEWVQTMVEVCRGIRHALKPTGTLWLNLGDAYAGSGRGGSVSPESSTLTGKQTDHSRVARNKHQAFTDDHKNASAEARRRMTQSSRRDREPVPRSDVAVAGLKPKDMMAQPWRVALALQADGWWLRQEIIWRKPNPMPESARDRFTKAHEHVFLLSKSERYFFNFEAVQEKTSGNAHARRRVVVPAGWAQGDVPHDAASHQQVGQHRKTDPARKNNGVGWGYAEGEDRKPRTVGVNPKAILASSGNDGAYAEGKSEGMGRGAGWRVKQNSSFSEATSGEVVETRNPRSVFTVDEDEYQQFLAWRDAQAIAPDVWDVPTFPFKGAHFATFPPDLARIAMRAGCPKGGKTLDPFGGSGTVGLVADQEQCDAVLIDLDKRNAPMAADRIAADSSLFTEVQVQS